MSDELGRLMRWYSSQCDGDWEHTWRVRISTIDNPGWRIKINLDDTFLSHAVFAPIRIERTEIDWVHCDVREFSESTNSARSGYSGAGGPGNLAELIRIFCDWAEQADR